MRASTCQRWREPPPNGALGSPWRAHLETCATCAGRAALSEDEKARLRAPEGARFDELTLRRARQRLLDDARRLVDPRHARPRRAARGAGAAAVALLVLCGGPSTREKMAVPSSVTPQGVTPEGAGASWSRFTDGDVEVLELRLGTFEIAVSNQRNHDGGRMFVRVPDGEIRDLGTVFRVTVSRAHTEAVSVIEGRVTIDARGAPPVVLVAGDRWRRVPDALAPPVPAPAAPASSRATPPRAPPPPARGVSAEDAAYLRVLQLLRDARPRKAQDEARQYLRRFPSGFRRDEMRDVAQPRQ